MKVCCFVVAVMLLATPCMAQTGSPEFRVGKGRSEYAQPQAFSHGCPKLTALS